PEYGYRGTGYEARGSSQGALPASWEVSMEHGARGADFGEDVHELADESNHRGPEWHRPGRAEGGASGWPGNRRLGAPGLDNRGGGGTVVGRFRAGGMPPARLPGAHPGQRA